VIDAIPALAWSASADGSADFFNQSWLEYTGLSAEQACDWGWTVALHADDVNGLVDYWRSVLAAGKPGEIEARLRRFDGVTAGLFSLRLPRSTTTGKLSNGSEPTPTWKIENVRKACWPERIAFWK